jgi:hypothetical protein
MIAPTDGEASVRRRYLPYGLVLVTTWDTQDGLLVVTDAMAFSRHDHGSVLRLGKILIDSGW